MTGSRIASLLLIVSLACFSFDLYHFAHHLHHDPSLLGLPGISLKLAWKGALVVLAAVLLLVLLTRRILAALLVTAVFFAAEPALGLAAMTRGSCERAREYLKEAGIARDAKETFFGNLKITPPRQSFPPEMDKVTWWGTFKPFEFWESPEFQAVWLNPQGGVVEQQTFRGGPCALAKTTLPVSQFPRGMLEPGMWRVIVSCQDVVIDNHPFAVIGSTQAGPDAGNDPGVMIWADDVRS
jgi:hypothetical protein